MTIPEQVRLQQRRVLSRNRHLIIGQQVRKPRVIEGLEEWDEVLRVHGCCDA